jgi:hypothetical protein
MLANVTACVGTEDEFVKAERQGSMLPGMGKRPASRQLRRSAAARSLSSPNQTHCR